MEDYKKQRFHELPGRAQASAITLLRLAMDDPEGHEVRVSSSGNKIKPYSYQVVLFKNQLNGPPVEETVDLVQQLAMNLEMASIVDGDWNRIRFTPDALDFYREMHPLTESEKREIIGRYFQKLGTGDDALVPFDAENLATELNFSSQEITQTVQSLANAGYLHDIGSRGSEFRPTTK